MDFYKETVVFEAHPEKGKGKRRASFEVRRSNIMSHSAIAVRLLVPPEYLQMPGTWRRTLDGAVFQVPNLKQREATVRDFDKMNRKLYRVTNEGCMIPHYSWGMRSAGNVDKGYQLVMDASYGWRPAGGGAGQVELLNSFGWSEVLQASHLCHMGPMCCNPSHVIAESRWRNLKRNYCGCAGQCDCCQGLPDPLDQFPCIAPYRSRDYQSIEQGGTEFITRPADVRNALDNYSLPGFFHSENPELSGWADKFIEGTHWEFIDEEEIRAWAAEDRQKAAELTVKRTRLAE